ncbi:putative aromatic di-alanine and TPR containing protein [Rhizoctonia solani 123E]|uniref:Putative aromatic di-alanine and TPR containing protein n=1 Tax=Rhizoctonia solani 123E TaxID=1423351 RepID=A0A074RUY0_9AGAM|nr:putative aromatic di-alanine and TPR containing protein [Rhizoctonia solani 123E]
MTSQTEDFSKIDYHARFHRSGDITDLDKDIEQTIQALSLNPEGDPCLFGNLGRSYQCRFQHRGTPSDLEHCIRYTTLAISLSPRGYPHLYQLFSTLSVCHHKRFDRLGNVIDLDKDIEYKTSALSLKPEGDPPMLSALGQSYRLRYNRLGSLSDLDKAIEYGTLAVGLSNDEESSLEGRLHQLGLTYRERFERSGNPSDLDMEINCRTRVVSLPGYRRGTPWQLILLAAAYNLRYHRFSDSCDLQKAIECNIRAFSLAGPADLSYQTRALVNLSILCLSRFEALGDPTDLELGIEYNARAYSLIPDNHPDNSTRLQNLSALYYARFTYLDDLGDLEQAIECSSLAVSLAADNNGDVAEQLDQLGHYIHARWHRLGHASDLHEDVVHKARAVSLTPEYHPGLPARLENLGRSYLGKLKVAKCQCDYRKTQQLALDSFRRSCMSEVGNPVIKLKSGISWARAAMGLSLEECLNGYQAAINLIPEVVWLGTTVVHRYQNLQGLKDLAAEAASTAIVAQDYARALEWLEQGRSIVMNQGLKLRSPLDDLYSVDFSLAEHLKKVATELHTTASRPHDSHSLTTDQPLPSPEEVALRHRQLAKKYADLLSQVRQISGFEDFLKPARGAELISAARTGPVVIINLYEPQGRCDALILQPGTTEIAHVGLPAFNSQTATDVRVRFGPLLSRGNLTASERGVRKLLIQGNISNFEDLLAILWNDIVKPVLDFLGYKPNTSLEELPHVTWCTTGILSSLPLHAAGIYGASRVCVSDYVISSYTPTLTALISSTPLSAATSILGVSQEVTPGNHASLPGTVQELAHIKAHVNDTLSYTQLTNGEASVEAVLHAMERHDCVHLACHAQQSVNDPTKSGFFLHDGTLDLVSIMGRSFKNKGLAFLSACQTAMGDQTLPDETVHLASSLITAGYPSVIATMWSVWDKDAPFVADKVYGALLKEGKMDCRESARALQYAITELRKEIGDDKFERWVPFIHIGS